MYPCEVVSLRWESCHIEKCLIHMEVFPPPPIMGVAVSEQGPRPASSTPAAEEERPKGEGRVGGQVGGFHTLSTKAGSVGSHPSCLSLAFPAQHSPSFPTGHRQTL